MLQKDPFKTICGVGVIRRVDNIKRDTRLRAREKPRTKVSYPQGTCRASSVSTYHNHALSSTTRKVSIGTTEHLTFRSRILHLPPPNTLGVPKEFPSTKETTTSHSKLPPYSFHYISVLRSSLSYQLSEVHPSPNFATVLIIELVYLGLNNHSLSIQNLSVVTSKTSPVIQHHPLGSFFYPHSNTLKSLLQAS